jgi:two-component system response regulator HydG
MNGQLLVIDDDINMCELLRDSLEQWGHEVVFHTDPADALDSMRKEDFDAVITDVRLGPSKLSGLEVCERVVTNRPDIPVIVMTAFGKMDTAVAAIRVGAYDFLTKPLDMNLLNHTVDRALQHRALNDEVHRLRRQVELSRHVGDLIGESKQMRRVYEIVQQVAAGDVSVLITGESGTGKELVARAIHDQGPRAQGRFIAVNCAAMPATLLESELFGHVRGAFTDAKDSRDGLFVQANGGTLLLDEIGEMPLEMQPKLLRVLQEQRVRPIGANSEVEFDARIIAATNRDLESDIEEGRFREDLFYRINVVNIRVPPLRSRGNDILTLAQHFLDNAAERMHKAVTGITTEAARRLLEYDWPGNVRELENSIERAVTLTRFEEITVDDLPEKIGSFESNRMVIQSDDPDEMPTLEEVERRYIARVLEAVGGNKTQAAQVLGLDRRTLYRRLERHGMKD